MLRWLIGKNFVKNTNYSDNKLLPIETVAHYVVYYGNVENKHWYDHIMLAIKTIIDHHPDTYVKHYWSNVYGIITTFIKLPDFVYRLLKERNDLNDKITNLTKWIDNNYDATTNDQREQLLLMQRYSELVNNRISKYCEDNHLIYNNEIDIRNSK